MKAALRFAGAGALGALSVLGFAPRLLFPLPLFTLAALIALWRAAPSARMAAFLGFAFGLGFFLAGVSWIYVSLHVYGGMPALLAALATLLFCAYLALYPGLAGWLHFRLRSRAVWLDALLAAACWTLAEWLRGWVFTGFPWLALGYSQAPPSPLAGFAPMVGVYGIGFLVVLLAGLLAAGWRDRRVFFGGLALAVTVSLGFGLGRIEWTQPVGGEVKVALLQTNIEQSLKWRPEMLERWLAVNLRLVRENPAQLVVLPETTLPLLADDLPAGYLGALTDAARRGGGDVVFGTFIRDQRGRIYNSAVSVGASPMQRYAKTHLVPFGEFSPPAFAWIYTWLSIPMSDQTRGPRDQPPLAVAGEQVAINICYEDVFGEEIIRAQPRATLLLNMSNLAWYGDSFAQPQHLQIAQLRALETGRYMLRATNTGMTAAVNPDGKVVAQLPPFTEGAVTVAVRGYTGLTPYARWGNVPVLLLSGVMFALGFAARRRSRGSLSAPDQACPRRGAKCP